MKKSNVSYYFLGCLLFISFLLWQNANTSREVVKTTPTQTLTECDGEWRETGEKMQTVASGPFSIINKKGEILVAVNEGGRYRLVYPILKCIKISPTPN